jgi:hypothetical protein
VHFLEAEDADRAALLLRSPVVGSDPDALEGVELGHFVGDRILGHRRQRAEDTDPPVVALPSFVCGSTRDEGVAAARFVERPIPKGDALDLNVQHAGDAVA